MSHKLERVAYWAQIISEWNASGLSKAEFCRRRGVPLASFKNWLYTATYREAVARFLAAPPQSPAPRLVPVVVCPDDESSNRPEPTPAGCSPEPPLQVILADGLRVAVGPGFDPETLRRLVDVLGAPR